MHVYYNTSSIILACCMYVYLIRGLRTGDTEQNLATWSSYALLDIVAGISLYVQGGNWYLLLVYIIGSTLVSCYNFGSAQFKIGKTEIVCFILVVVSIIMWYRSGPWYATIISVVGVLIATYPQIEDTIMMPVRPPIEVYLGFGVVNLLNTLGGKAWTVEERLYPAACVGMNLVLIGCCLWNFYKRPRGA